jgi:hypothetical protein
MMRPLMEITRTGMTGAGQLLEAYVITAAPPALCLPGYNELEAISVMIVNDHLHSMIRDLDLHTVVIIL